MKAEFYKVTLLNPSWTFLTFHSPERLHERYESLKTYLKVKERLGTYIRVVFSKEIVDNKFCLNSS